MRKSVFKTENKIKQRKKTKKKHSIWEPMMDNPVDHAPDLMEQWLLVKNPRRVAVSSTWVPCCPLGINIEQSSGL